MGGSVVLNPPSAQHHDLKRQFSHDSINDLYVGDARASRHNSKNYFQCATIVNNNAKTLSDWLYKQPDLIVVTINVSLLQ